MTYQQKFAVPGAKKETYIKSTLTVCAVTRHNVNVLICSSKCATGMLAVEQLAGEIRKSRM